MSRTTLAAAAAALLALAASQSYADAPPADKTFADKAAAGGLAEVVLGKLAMQNAGSNNVKVFGQRMVSDHMQANDALMAIAQKESLVLPMTPDSATNEMAAKLRNRTGEAFDQAYIDHMVRDHKEDVADFEKEATSGGNPRLKNFALEYLPVLKQHLALAESLQSK